MAVESGRLLLVGDDTTVREAVEAAFRGEGFDVCAASGRFGVERIVESFRPDIAILDVCRPMEPDDCSMLRQLRKLDDLPVVLLTSTDSLDDRLTGFRAGADDFLSKPFSMDELLVRVQAVLRRSRRSATATATHRIGDVVVDDAARKVARGGVEVDLTRTEYDLLSAFCRHSGQVLSKQQLLQEVWGGSDHFGDNVVEVHLSALRRKLEALGPRVIHTVRGAGYILRSGA